jgi:hypothetical protein
VGWEALLASGALGGLKAEAVVGVDEGWAAGEKAPDVGFHSGNQCETVIVAAADTAGAAGTVGVGGEAVLVVVLVVNVRGAVETEGSPSAAEGNQDACLSHPQIQTQKGSNQ